MWLLATSLAAAVTTAIWYISDEARKTYKIGFLNLIFWGSAIMIFVDHVIGYLTEGGEFIDTSPDAILLSMVLIIVAVLLWDFFLLIKDPKGIIKT